MSKPTILKIPIGTAEWVMFLLYHNIDIMYICASRPHVDIFRHDLHKFLSKYSVIRQKYLDMFNVDIAKYNVKAKVYLKFANDSFNNIENSLIGFRGFVLRHPDCTYIPPAELEYILLGNSIKLSEIEKRKNGYTK